MSAEMIQDNDNGETREYITAVIGKQLFGMHINDVHDVFIPQNMTPVPQARGDIAGVLNLRGRIVTAIDMRRKLGLPLREKDALPMAVGIEHKGESYGLVIDEVGEVMRLQNSAIEATPTNLDSKWAEIATGVCRLEGQLMVLLDVSRVLAMSSEPVAA
ncbi:chemotaxis protein CheW [Tepidamorphus sp. 3E244]|uniref:chemotaxis protein CheW n=1 Tax=Tepidamorphus sp. 3E244 TaxID=3385498 RepID=UPI0038FBE8F8